MTSTTPSGSGMRRDRAGMVTIGEPTRSGRFHLERFLIMDSTSPMTKAMSVMYPSTAGLPRSMRSASENSASCSVSMRTICSS